MSIANKLIFDIETIGEDFDSLDQTTQDVLTRWIKKESENEKEYRIALADLKQGLGFSPLTGEIVSIGVLDHAKNQGVVYFQAPGSGFKQTKKDNIIYKPMDEKSMLDAFWKGALNYQHFITFNGRMFDVPFLVLRSAIHNIRPTKDLMRGRYLYMHNADAVHIDLFDQLTFYGAMRGRRALHMYARAFGIPSPKADEITGDKVKEFFEKKKFLEIAEYNAGDLFATKELYDKWDSYLRF
jgi:3'-5' exonuclease